MHILIRNIGSTNDGQQINLRITNESEYRAWNSRTNGVKKAGEGAFGSVNMLGPRAIGSRPASKFWNNL